MLSDAYVNAPVEVDVGAVKVNAASPNVLLIAAKVPIVGIPFTTVIVLVTVPAL